MENSFIKVAACTLNQWALDFAGNKERIARSISLAKEAGAILRVGPEMEVCGNDCEDHLYEIDTVLHSWEVAASLMSEGYTDNIVVVLGMPVSHHGILFDCSVVIHNRQVILIKPKITLSDDGNYREGRWFTAWRKHDLEEFRLPNCIQTVKGQEVCPIGHAIVDALDTSFMMEMCEEMWSPMSSSIQGGLEGAEIFVNQSASHGFVGKTRYRLYHINDNLYKNGGIYIYSNFIGCGGSRLVYDGNSSISLNGKLMKIDEAYSFKDVVVISSELNLNEVRSHRIAFKARANDAQKQFFHPLPRVKLNLRMASRMFASSIDKPMHIEDVLFSKAEEMVNLAIVYMWDYLRGSKAGGFFLPLSGGADSASVLTLVYAMCTRICQEAKQDKFVLQEIRKIVGDANYEISNAQELMSRIMFTAYLSTKNSSNETRSRAKRLAEEVGASHLEADISGVYEAFKGIAEGIFGEEIKYKAGGGSNTDDLSLQNIQSRSRLVLTYLLAGLIPQHNKGPRPRGFLLVLGSANLAEGLRGYFTKYDNSSADINPIGSLAKSDIRSILSFGCNKLGLKVLQEVLDAQPTAELRPLAASGATVQTDEEDMGVKYEELETFAFLRKNKHCGPLSMFLALLSLWEKESPKKIAEKVKFFFKSYANNRHKMTIMTPSIHIENYSADDNRYDLRPFLYASDWEVQFRAIDNEVELLLATK